MLAPSGITLLRSAQLILLFFFFFYCSFVYSTAAQCLWEHEMWQNTNGNTMTISGDPSQLNLIAYNYLLVNMILMILHVILIGVKNFAPFCECLYNNVHLGEIACIVRRPESLALKKICQPKPSTDIKSQKCNAPLVPCTAL